MSDFLKYYKIAETAHNPVFSTNGAACFDICAHLVEGERVQMLDYYNSVVPATKITDGKIVVHGGCRALIPTGLIFNIPKMHSLRLHPRSGLAWKRGIQLANCEGVIDCDYYHETFIALFNTSEEPFEINNGDRVAQGELVADRATILARTFEKPEPTTDRKGGFGSTGLAS